MKEHGKSSTQQESAYTSPRPDVAAMVPRQAKKILDVGCSNGELGHGLLHDRPDRSVVGIERDPDYAARAALRLNFVICEDLDSLDWDALSRRHSFDCVIFADVLEHLVDPLSALSGARRCLEADGCVVLSLPNIRHVSCLWQIYFLGTFPRRSRGIFDGTHLRWFTIADARQLLKDAGYDVQAADYSLRLLDQGGGHVNDAVRRLLGPVRRLFPVREFLSYQFCIRAT